MELAEAVSLVLFYTGAFLMPPLASRVHMPAAVAEILFGLALGLTGLVHEGGPTAFLAELGFVYLMFLVGMEIDFNRIEAEGRRTVVTAFIIAASVLGLAAFIASRAGLAPFVGLVVGAMSVGVMLVALVESGATKTRWGQVLLLVGSLGEFLTLMTLTAYHLVHEYGVGWTLAQQALRVFLLFFVAFFVLGMLRLSVWWFPHSFGRWVREEDPSELGVRFGFVLMLGLTALAAWGGLEPILGAFLAGLLLSYVFRETGALETKLVALGQGFFVPIFFINVGLTFEWGGLADASTLGRTLLILGGASLAAKLVPSLLLLLVGIPLRAAAAGAFLLATPLTLLVAMAALGREMEVIDASTSGSIILLAIVTGVVFPVAFKLIAPRVAKETSHVSEASPPTSSEIRIPDSVFEKRAPEDELDDDA